MRLKYTRIATRLQRHGLSLDESWDAIGKTYIMWVTNPPNEVESEAQAAELFFKKCLGWHWAWRLQPSLIEKAVATRQAIEDSLPEEQPEELFEAPRQTEGDIDFISDIIKAVPQQFKIPLTVVCHALLSRGLTKPLTVETCRRILKEHKIPNTSENARQIYTFLTTWRP